MSKLKHICLFFLSGVSFCLFGQEDSLEGVTIYPNLQKTLPVALELPKKIIESQLAADLGQLTLFFPGVQLKSYGDIGGMKTVQFRSLGAGHSTFIQDYQQLATSQSGQADLSQIPAEFIHSLALISLNPTNVYIPVSAKLAGNILFMQSQLLHHSNDKSGAKLSVQLGSFKQYQGTLFGKIYSKKMNWAASGKMRSYDGNYPFTYKNGNTLEHTTRLNNGLFEYYGNLIGEYRIKNKHKLRLLINANHYKKELAGAVIFYNPSIDQYLSGYAFGTGIQHELVLKKSLFFTRFNYQYQALQYVDSSYLNNQGYLDNRYYSQQIDGDFQWKKQLSTNWAAALGGGLSIENVQSKTLPNTPNRTTVPGFIGLERTGVFNFSLQIGQQFVAQNNHNQGNNWHFLPALAAGFKLGKAHLLQVILKSTLRQPSFSEMYYQQIGNTNLKPENAALASLRYNFDKIIKRWQTNLILEPYFTRVNNKILAIPTKNLFIWSIQNIGRTQAFGIEATFQNGIQLKHHLLSFRTNYTFQYATDVSDKNSAVYGNILSYSPLHTGAVQVAYSWKNVYLFVSGNAMSSRYTLNENKPAYLITGFYSIDAGINYKHTLKKGQFGVNFQLKNLTNNYYSYIAYFILPGINGTIRLTYEF